MSVTMFVKVLMVAVLCAPALATTGGRLAPSFRATHKRMPSTSTKTPRNSAAFLHKKENATVVSTKLRAGGQAANVIPRSDSLDKTVRAIVQITWGACKVVAPPTIACVRAINAFYRALPKDAIIAQAGLVYCFAGGYYPTLFSAVQAARSCGWENMLIALDELSDEAGAAIDAAAIQFQKKEMTARETFTETSMAVLRAVDPVKINQATSALYTTWLGVSTVLEREFAKTIALSVSIAGYLKPVTSFVLGPPLRKCIPEDYHQWVPVLLGWTCKAAAMSVAWRIERVFTAYTSAITGGLMFSRAIMRMLHKKGVRLFGVIREDDEESFLDEILGLAVAGLGMYSQMGNGFDFRVPYPLALVTWPFDWAEKWIQWQITREE